VIGQEDSIDSSLEALFRQLLSYMIEDPRRIRGALRYSIIAKNLEQIGDGAVEIAENVIYLIDGSDIRHRGGRKSSSED
jgi:phosphate transport system protein